MTDELDFRRRRVRFRADHRGTKEADLLIGGFVLRHVDNWGPAELTWAEVMLNEQDVDIMAWAIGKTDCPPHIAGELMTAMQRLDYIATVPR